MDQKRSEVWHKCLAKLPPFTDSMLDELITRKKAVKVKYERGYKFFLEGYVHDFEVCENEFDWAIRSKCFHSQKKNNNPHAIRINFRRSEVIDASCTCAAGKGLYHHTVAVLYQFKHCQKLGLKVVPPLASKTSMPQKWHIPSRTGGITPAPTTKIRVQKSMKKVGKRPKTNESAEGVSSTLYNAVSDPLSSIRLDQLMVPAMSHMIPPPQFVQLWDASNEPVPMQDTVFGEVPLGSILSYQLADHSAAVTEDIVSITDAPPIPAFAPPNLPRMVQCALTYKTQCAYNSLEVTLQQSLDYEVETRKQSTCDAWKRLREHRITASKFKRVCSRKADFDSLAKSMRSQKVIRTKHMLHGIEHEPVAVQPYADAFARSVYLVGFVINPSAHHLGCSPDRRVFDAEADPSFGLLEIKCPVQESINDCKYLTRSPEGFLHLKKSHEYYYQIIGQLGLTGNQWCDLFVKANADYHCERIYFDQDFFYAMKEKLDIFYLNHFLPLNEI